MMKRKAIFIAVLIFLLFIATQIVTSSIGFMMATIDLPDGAETFETVSPYLPLFPMAGNLLFLILATILLRRKKTLRKLCHISIVPAKQYLLPLTAILLYSIAGNFLLNALPFPEEISGNIELMKNIMERNSIVYCLAVYLVAPITEEVVFRGMIQTRLRRTMNATPTILISSALFGAAHFMTGSPATVLFAFFGGILFGLTYEKTGSLLPAIAIHILGNLCELSTKIAGILSLPLQYTISFLFLIGCGIIVRVLVQRPSHFLKNPH